MSQSGQAKRSYQKPWLCWSDQVAKLEARGILVENHRAAASFLSHINYYRFSGYSLAFEVARHQLLPNTTFDQIRAAYEFDCRLRDLVMEALEFVEVDLRTSIAYCFGQAYGPFAHVDPSHFHCRPKVHARWLNRVQEESARSSEAFVDHFKRQYLEFPHLPIWVVTEIMSFGALSVMYREMLRREQRGIARRYGVQATTLGGWMHHMVYIRNLCAHHARLWDRVWTIKAPLPHGRAWQPPQLSGNDRIFTTLLILYHMKQCCDGIAPAPANWRDKVIGTLRNLPSTPKAAALLGLPNDWESHPLWA